MTKIDEETKTSPDELSLLLEIILKKAILEATFEATLFNPFTGEQSLSLPGNIEEVYPEIKQRCYDYKTHLQDKGWSFIKDGSSFVAVNERYKYLKKEGYRFSSPRKDWEKLFQTLEEVEIYDSRENSYVNVDFDMRKIPKHLTKEMRKKGFIVIEYMDNHILVDFN